MHPCLTACLRLMPWHACSNSKANVLTAGSRRSFATAVSSVGNSGTPVCPKEPGPEDCCQSGCEHCVWEVYNQELKRYMQYMQQQGRPAEQVAAAKKASQQQRVAASLDAFEQLERQLQSKQQNHHQQQQP